jgi:hypothetical protein
VVLHKNTFGPLWVKSLDVPKTVTGNEYYNKGRFCISKTWALQIWE